MIVGKVVGSIVSTRKSDKLIGQKFMIVEPARLSVVKVLPLPHLSKEIVVCRV